MGLTKERKRQKPRLNENDPFVCCYQGSYRSVAPTAICEALLDGFVITKFLLAIGWLTMDCQCGSSDFPDAMYYRSEKHLLLFWHGSRISMWPPPRCQLSPSYLYLAAEHRKASMVWFASKIVPLRISIKSRSLFKVLAKYRERV